MKPLNNYWSGLMFEFFSACYFIKFQSSFFKNCMCLFFSRFLKTCRMIVVWVLTLCMWSAKNIYIPSLRCLDPPFKVKHWFKLRNVVQCISVESKFLHHGRPKKTASATNTKTSFHQPKKKLKFFFLEKPSLKVVTLERFYIFLLKSLCLDNKF